ncbi:hypothetical protein GOODEAATRI_029138 [Goodea atripinnis]|uniref:Secreted protein n=1 Tax=Goodea atripinnis TaxID=208336 RepID=A0ABV0NFI4_9TELE
MTHLERNRGPAAGVLGLALCLRCCIKPHTRSCAIITYSRKMSKAGSIQEGREAAPADVLKNDQMLPARTFLTHDNTPSSAVLPSEERSYGIHFSRLPLLPPLETTDEGRAAAAQRGHRRMLP